jgi:extradiol dioxygenase family protein
LSAWTKDNAKKYGIYTVHLGNFKIIKLKIYIKNIGAVIKNEDWKIRAKKIEVI